VERVFAGLIMGLLDLSFLRLRKRIFAGYFLIGFLTFLIILFSYFSINRLFTQFKHFTRFGDNAQLGLTLSRDVTELQRAAELYMNDGLVSAEKQVAYIYDNLMHLISNFNLVDNDRVTKGVDIINKRLHTYHGAFEQVKIQRRLQKKLIDEDIRSYASVTEELTAAYIKTLSRDTDTNKINLANQLMNNILLIEKNTYRYFDSLDATMLSEARKQISETKQLIDELQAAENRADASWNLRFLKINLNDYHEVILEAVQRTRGYLYLVNVVMAADAYEIRYQSEKLSGLVQQEMKSIEEEITAVIRRVTASVLAVSLIFLLLIAVLSYSIGQSISAPILRLTEIFRQLAKGRVHTPIDVDSSKDEIGELTHAAEVFREKNNETRELLQKYQDLSEQLEEKVQDRTRALEMANSKLESLSNTDGLTGLPNRRFFDATLVHEWARSQRSQLSLSVIMVDVDFFKRYNDHYGHQAGDDCLKLIAGVLKRCLKRDTDMAARYGGEEFVIILQDTGTKMAMQIAESLRKEVEEIQLSHEDSELGVLTLSLGVASFDSSHPLQDKDDLIRLADDALYQSKRQGRNRVSLAGHENMSGESAFL
jgi:diguanylate cyclase (GGDEF)-like protein